MKFTFFMIFTVFLFASCKSNLGNYSQRQGIEYKEGDIKKKHKKKRSFLQCSTTHSPIKYINNNDFQFDYQVANDQYNNPQVAYLQNQCNESIFKSCSEIKIQQDNQSIPLQFFELDSNIGNKNISIDYNNNGDFILVWKENYSLYAYIYINGSVAFRSMASNEKIDQEGFTNNIIYKFSAYIDNQGKAFVDYVKLDADTNPYRLRTYSATFNGANWSYPSNKTDNLLDQNTFSAYNSYINHYDKLKSPFYHIKRSENNYYAALLVANKINHSNSFSPQRVIIKNNLNGSIEEEDLLSDLNNNGYAKNYNISIDSDIALSESGRGLAAFSFATDKNPWSHNPGMAIYVAEMGNGIVSMPSNVSDAISYNVSGLRVSNGISVISRSFKPHIALNDSNNGIISWVNNERNYYSNYDHGNYIYVAEYGNGIIGAPKKLSAKLSYNVRSNHYSSVSYYSSSISPVSSITSDGFKIVTWAADDNNGSTQIYYSIKCADSGSWSSPIQATATNSKKENLKVIHNNDNEFHLFWESQDNFANYVETMTVKK